MSTELDDAIVSLHQAFETVRAPKQIEACPCCFDEDHVKQLLAVPRKDVAEELLAEYASSALTTIGSVDDYLYFLPSILEAEATSPTWWESVEITGSRIQKTDLGSWPKNQQSALKHFYLAWLKLLASSEGDDGEDGNVPVDLDSVLCAIGGTGLDISFYLDALAPWPSAIGRLHEENARYLNKKGRLNNPFWDTESESHDAVIEWLASAEVIEIAEQYFKDLYY